MSDDLISRQAAIDAVEKNACNTQRIYDAIKGLPAAQPEQRWISVTERLPRNDEEVIVTCIDDSGDTAFSYTTVAWCYNGIWICDNERNLFVVAWRELPEPYREDGQE